MSIPTEGMRRDNLHIDGWVTPRLEAVLQEAVQIANASPGDYLGIEHVMLAILSHHDSPTLTDCLVSEEKICAWRDELKKLIVSTDPVRNNQPITIGVRRNQHPFGADDESSAG